MKLYKSSLFIVFLLFSLPILAQQFDKTLEAVRVDHPPKIDGVADEAVWQKAKIATNFLQFIPGDGDPMPPEYKTEVRILYDDLAIYVLATMKDPDAYNVPQEFGLRDQFVQADMFAIYLNPFVSPGNTYFFGVFASGAQVDGVQSQMTDTSWNAVWKSAVGFNDDNWVVEMKIPYSALRFQNEPNQTWGLSFARHMVKQKEDYSWVYFDKKKKGDIVQFLGELTNLKNIKPPVRLSLYPYASISHNRYEGDNSTHYGYGMDLKYGINAAYTLDATLIPDFSDTAYDDLNLNLGPFEQYYSEKRQFFTEGFDLFNKGQLFYSRRIGSTPSDYNTVYEQINNNEEVVENPQKVNLINAVKISGRNKNGLGIGFFNAITNKSEAIIRNVVNNTSRKITTEPYANYNVMVLDYNYSGNSSVSLINTNVIRQGSARDADVVGLDYAIYGQNNSLKFSGTSAMSMINDNDNTWQKGYKFNTAISKQINEHGFGVSLRSQDKNFDINDLGYNRRNNFANLDISYSYRILKPSKHFNSFNLGFDVGFDHRFEDLSKIQNDFSFDVHATNKHFLSYGLGIEYVTDAYDYYEPRVAGRFYLDKRHGGVWAYVSTDYRKKFAFDAHIARFAKVDDTQNYFSFQLSPRLRLSNQFKLNYSLKYQIMNNFKGFVDIVNNDIIFGNRMQKSITNSLGSNYYFNTKSALNLNFRHNWTPVTYTNFYTLNNNGTLSNTTYANNVDINYNIWNIDLTYLWEFAPGSKLSLLYRNTIFNTDDQSQLSFGDNINNLFKKPQEHTFVAKVIYYIDYNTIKNRWF